MTTLIRPIVLIGMTGMTLSLSSVAYSADMTGYSVNDYRNTSSNTSSYTDVANSTALSAGASVSTTSGRLAGSSFGGVRNGQIPSQSTSQEAVQAASLPSNSLIHLTRPYQDIQSNDRMFGEQLFRGAFSSLVGSNFNDSYVIKSGDNIQVRMWGAYQYAASMTVDPQGNIFLPNVGTVKVSGVANGNLQTVVETAIRRIYRSNVGIYASLEEAQPVKVYVTGFVRQPGLYGGLASDSVLSYLDRSGGVDPKRGSYIDIEIMRNGRMMQRVDLYDFLWNGRLKPFAFKDGDVVRVTSQKQTFTVSGAVQNAYTYEYNMSNWTVADVLAIANPNADATHFNITRSAGRAKTSEYHSMNQAMNVPIHNGDEVVVTSDRYDSTMAISVQGAHTGNGMVILPYGARLRDVIQQLQPSALANMSHLKIYRESVAVQQKKKMNEALDRLEQMTLASQSITKEEAALRQDDAQLIKEFIAKARQVEPSGQIVVVEDSWQDVILQSGDIIEIPEYTSVISVNGEVRAQGALTYNPTFTVGDYIAKSGGFGDNANKDEILIIHQNGEHQVVNTVYRIQQGDMIMVIPKIKTKNVEISRGISQILYQLAIATRVIVGL